MKPAIDTESFRGYLGEEFLTWLWYRTETERASYTIVDANGQEREFGVFIDDYLVLRQDEKLPAEAALEDDQLWESAESILRRGTPSRSAEAGVALLKGKKLSKAKLLISDGDQEWSLVLDAQDFVYRSVKLPKPETEDEQERDLENLVNLHRMTRFLDSVYAIFLEERLDPDFRTKVVPDMGDWILRKANLA
ncbi:MAG: hypothetical protein H6834_06745 [Planctomycetes bacterium]|nr:hypothetical protein [Planctomycetota bacterium]